MRGVNKDPVDDVETRLRAYRPVGPRPELRTRVLAVPHPQTWILSGRAFRWGSLAAALVVTVGLGLCLRIPHRVRDPHVARKGEARPEMPPPTPALPAASASVPPPDRRIVARRGAAPAPEVLVRPWAAASVRRFTEALGREPVEPASFLNAGFAATELQDPALQAPVLEAQWHDPGTADAPVDLDPFNEERFQARSIQ